MYEREIYDKVFIAPCPRSSTPPSPRGVFAASLSSLALEPPLSPPAPLAAAGVSSTTGPRRLLHPAHLPERERRVRAHHGRVRRPRCPLHRALVDGRRGSALARALFATSPQRRSREFARPAPRRRRRLQRLHQRRPRRFRRGRRADDLRRRGRRRAGRPDGASVGRGCRVCSADVTSPRSSQFAGLTAGRRAHAAAAAIEPVVRRRLRRVRVGNAKRRRWDADRHARRASRAIKRAIRERARRRRRAAATATRTRGSS